MLLIGLEVVIQMVQLPPYRYFRDYFPAYVLIVQTVRRRVSSLSALTFCIRLSKKQEPERFHVCAFFELSTVSTSSTALCEQADLDFRTN